MTYRQIQEEIPNLSMKEKAELLQFITNSITQSYPGIEKNPGVAGGSACILRTRIPVWTLEGFRQAGLNEAQLLFDFPTLRAIDLVNAWNYVVANKEEILNEIRENGQA
jgi:uncharacterized protein (DUF433 family)